MSSVYNYDYKKGNKFDSNQIISKSVSLRAIMNLNSKSESEKLLFEMPFHNISQIFQWGQFSGYLCIK